MSAANSPTVSVAPVSSLNAPARLKALAVRIGIAAARPSSTAGGYCPSCGAPMLWNWKSLNIGPRWHSWQPPRPMKISAPWFAIPAVGFNNPMEAAALSDRGYLGSDSGGDLHAFVLWNNPLVSSLADRAARQTGDRRLRDRSGGPGPVLRFRQEDRAAGRAVVWLQLVAIGLVQLEHAASTTAWMFLAIALGKILTTGLTIGSGGSGGVFGPSMAIGGCGGGALGIFLQHCQRIGRGRFPILRVVRWWAWPAFSRRPPRLPFRPWSWSAR